MSIKNKYVAEKNLSSVALFSFLFAHSVQKCTKFQQIVQNWSTEQSAINFDIFVTCKICLVYLCNVKKNWKQKNPGILLPTHKYRFKIIGLQQKKNISRSLYYNEHNWAYQVLIGSINWFRFMNKKRKNNSGSWHLSWGTIIFLQLKFLWTQSIIFRFLFYMLTIWAIFVIFNRIKLCFIISERYI